MPLPELMPLRLHCPVLLLAAVGLACGHPAANKEHAAPPASVGADGGHSAVSDDAGTTCEAAPEGEGRLLPGCTCQPGFAPNAEGDRCEDVNECESESYPCGDKACVNSAGSFACACPEGTLDALGDATRCVQAVADVVAGGDHVCALTSAGKVVCWGRDGLQQVSGANASTGPYQEVGASIEDTCARTGAGAVECWGGSGGPPQPGHSYAQLSVGTAHICALTASGGIDCWGNPLLGAAPAEDEVKKGYVKVSAGWSQTCALTREGAIHCWGGEGVREATEPNASKRRYRDLSAGFKATCAISTTGALECWGGDSFVADAVAGANGAKGRFDQVVVGDGTICALTEAGRIQCFGSDELSFLKDPEKAVGPYRRITTQGTLICAVTSAGSIDCWGKDRYGALLGATGAQRRVTSVKTDSVGDGCALDDGNHVTCWSPYGVTAPSVALVSLTAGYSHFCGRSQEGKVVCWDTSQTTRTQVPPGAYVEVSAGFDQSCAVTEQHKLACWFDTSEGPVAEANAAQGAYRAVSVDGGICALTTQGQVRCWERAARSRPTPSDGPFESIQLAGDTLCTLTKDGKLHCWGSELYATGDSAAHEGINATTDRFTDLGLSRIHGCALTEAGRLKCWGVDEYGEVNEPSAAVGPFTEVSAALHETCAARANGTFACWGQFDIDSSLLVVTHRQE